MLHYFLSGMCILHNKHQRNDYSLKKKIARKLCLHIHADQFHAYGWFRIPAKLNTGTRSSMLKVINNLVTNSFTKQMQYLLTTH